MGQLYHGLTTSLKRIIGSREGFEEQLTGGGVTAQVEKILQDARDELEDIEQKIKTGRKLLRGIPEDSTNRGVLFLRARVFQLQTRKLELERGILRSEREGARE